ncbi:MAG: sigma-70 family RNA polymerase sigma factor [Spirosomataceae bacterium]
MSDNSNISIFSTKDSPHHGGRVDDKNAFGHLAQTYYRPLYHYGLRLCTDSDLVHDCIQELFLELWERRHSMTEIEFVKTYLLRALRNKVIKESIRLKKIKEAEELAFEAMSEPSVESRIVENEHHIQQIKQLNLHISQLTKRQQEIIYLRFYQNMEYEDISNIMELTKQSVANLLHRTIKDIRDNWSLPSLLFFIAVSDNFK